MIFPFIKLQVFTSSPTAGASIIAQPKTKILRIKKSSKDLLISPINTPKRVFKKGGGEDKEGGTSEQEGLEEDPGGEVQVPGLCRLGGLMYPGEVDAWKVFPDRCGPLPVRVFTYLGSVDCAR